jgi:hypothetical protein
MFGGLELCSGYFDISVVERRDDVSRVWLNWDYI